MIGGIELCGIFSASPTLLITERCKTLVVHFFSVQYETLQVMVKYGHGCRHPAIAMMQACDKTF